MKVIWAKGLYDAQYQHMLKSLFARGKMIQNVTLADNTKVYDVSGKRLGKVKFFHMTPDPMDGKSGLIHMEGYMTKRLKLPCPVEIRQTVSGITIASYYVMLRKNYTSYKKEVRNLRGKKLYFFQSAEWTMSNLDKLVNGCFKRDEK